MEDLWRNVLQVALNVRTLWFSNYGGVYGRFAAYEEEMFGTAI